MTFLSLSIAQIAIPQPPPEVFGTWLFNFGMVMAILYMIVRLLASALAIAKPKPPLEGIYATRDDLLARKADCEHALNRARLECAAEDTRLAQNICSMQESVKEDIRDLSKKQTEHTRGTHERIDKILAAVSALEGEMKHVRVGVKPS
jgi:hypothetical protein